jgi:hypothetical protein
MCRHNEDHGGRTVRPHVPTLAGGDGHASVVDFYTRHFVGKMPADTRIERIRCSIFDSQICNSSKMFLRLRRLLEF